MPAQMPFSVLMGAILLVVFIVFVVLPNTSAIESDEKKLRAAGSLPGCCLEFANPVKDICSKSDSEVLGFQCSVPKEISSSEKMSISEVYKKVNNVAADADKIRETCQCGPRQQAP